MRANQTRCQVIIQSTLHSTRAASIREAARRCRFGAQYTIHRHQPTSKSSSAKLAGSKNGRTRTAGISLRLSRPLLSGVVSRLRVEEAAGDRYRLTWRLDRRSGKATERSSPLVCSFFPGPESKAEGHIELRRNRSPTIDSLPHALESGRGTGFLRSCNKKHEQRKTKRRRQSRKEQPPLITGLTPATGPKRRGLHCVNYDH